MANPNDNLYRLYQNGLKHFSLPDFDTFKQDMMDEQKRKRFYTNMQEAYSLPDFNTFSKDIGTVAPPPTAAPAQQAAQAQPQQQAVTPTVQPIKDNTAQQASVQSATTPAQPAGWKPSPVQQQYMQWQMDEANVRLKKMGEDFHQRMEGIEKGNRPGSFMGEREFNSQTGQMEKVFYTTQGERVPTQLQKIKADSDYHQWWENNTEAGKRSKEQRLQREFDDRLSRLWDRPDRYDAAEKAWSAAEAAYYSKVEKNRDAANFQITNFAMNSSDAVAFKQVEEIDNFTDRLTTHDLDNLMNTAWANLGEKGQQALIDDCYKMLRYRNPGADELVLYNQAKDFARQQSDLRLYNLAVEKNAPKSSLEYFMRKVKDMNLVSNIGKGVAVNRVKKTGDMAAYEAANEQYRQDGHRILDVTGMVAGFALDPTTWMSAGVGGAATRGTMWLGGRWLAGRGASAAVTQAATRQFATSMTGRIVGGIAGGAANFGTFEGVKEMENQFAHGGHIVGQDETGRYINEGYSAGAVAGQFGYGLMMGAAVGWLDPVSGNVSDKLVRATSSTVGKVATRAGVYTGATLAEGTIFSVPEWIEGERDAMDVWSDNMAMMVGFKAKHMLKSAGGVLGDLKASFDSPTNGQKNRLDFESRLRQRMDAPSDGGMGLTEDEKAELKRYGYDLRDLVESSERTGDPAEGSLIAKNAPEIVSRLTDMVTDPRVSEAARAKMYYYATGRRLPMSTVMRGELIEDGDGGFIVESQGANGVITSRSFKSRKAADLELECIKRQTELNSIEIGERYQQTADFENRLQEACRTVAAENGWDMVEVYRTCEEARRNHLRGGDKQFDEAQQNILRKVTEAMGEFEETGATDAMRGRINEKYGVDIDGAIRKEANRRTQQEQMAIDEYIAELIPDKAKEPNPVEDAQAEDITNQKLLSDEPAGPQGPGEGEPIDPRFDDSTPSEEFDPHQFNGELWPTGRAVMKFQDRPVEVLSGRVVMMEDGTMVDSERSDASIVIRDLATGKMEMVSPDAILSYEAYPETLSVEEVEAMQGEGAEAPQPEVEPQSKYTSGQIKIRNSDGTETRGVLTGYVDENGNHEYYVEGDLQHLHYASEQELNNILSEYQPDEPQQPSAAQPQAEERVYPEGVTDTEAYDNGLEDGAGSTSWSDEELNSTIARFNDESNVATLTDYGRGWLEGLKQEQQRRVQAAQPEQPQQPEQVAPIEPTPAPAPVPTPEPTATPAPEPAQAPAEAPQGEVTMPTGVNPVGTIAVPLRDGSTRTFTVGKDAEGQNVLIDDRGFMWAHDGNGNAMQPYSPGANVPTWTDEQLSKLGAVQPSNEQPATVPNQPENVPTSTETPQNPTENAVAPAESVPNPAAPVENVQETPAPTAEPTPLQRIPRDAKGEPIFEQAENPEHGWDALVEFAEGDAATAKEIADTMAEEKRKAYEKAQKQKPKGKTPTEILASKKAISAGLAQAEQEYNLWQQMANVEQRRQDAIRAQQEAEARQRAAERAEAEKAEREAREEAARLEREALEGIPEWHLDTPENARKRGVRRFSGQMFTRQEPVQGVVGNEVEVKFSQKDLPKGHVAVIEASQLQPSHIQGQRNPMFFIEEAQPKNRAEAVSMYAAKEMAEGIRPQEITGSATAYTGAPTVNTRGEVIQGNNRSDALRYLWDNHLPEQQQTYKQYLLDNAEQLGLASEAINAMQHPVLVNMLDVDDAEAIRLGQMTAQDTESGGIERIKPKNVAQKLGEDMRSFASQLLRSGDEEATFGQLVDRNGTDVLKWMAQKGAITNTQYQSAFDSKGNLTAEAKNDLQKVLYQAVFKGGSQQLEEMFDALPAKAQRAILSTAFRDMDSPFAGKMLPEIQASIAAFNQLMNDPTFAAAKKMEEVLRVVEGFKRSIQLDDRFEQYMPADNFSNFALHLAAMYKANDMSQSTLTSYFNQMYDLAQGKKAATLFEEADTTEYPLADVIKQVLNIDYKPAKNGNNNVADGGADVALRNQNGQGGELRGNEPPASGEQNPTGTEPSDRGAGTSDDSRGGGNLRVSGKGETAAQEERLTKEEASGIIAEMEEKAIVALEIELTIENWDAQFGEDGIVSTPIGNVKMGENQFTKLMRQGRNGKLGMIKPTLETPDIIIEDASEAKDAAATERESSYVFVKTFVKPDGSRYYYFTSVTVSKDGHEVVISNQEKRRNVLTNLLMKGKLVWKHADDASSASDVADGLFSSQGNMSDPVSEGTDAPQTNDSDRKVNNSATEKQVSGQESSVQPSDNKGEQTVQTAVEAASAQVNTEPTPAQAEAGNYKKGHVTIGEFDITIENPAGSLRKGVDADGKEWSTQMANTYGYIKGTEGVDGDHIDVFLHENMDEWNGRKVFVVDQTNTDGSFDEHKVMLGFNDKDEAMNAYLANYDKTWVNTHPGLRISETNIEDFNKWVQSSHRKTKPFAEYSTVSKVVDEVPVKTEPQQPSQPEANIGEGYKIEPKPYTNKQGKTLDTYLVTFDRNFSKEELSALRAKAKALKGWYDRESKGWMLRSSDDAKAFADEVAVKSEDEVADEAPLSMADMEKTNSVPRTKSTAKSESPIKQVDVEGMFDSLKTKGETKLSDHAAPVAEPKPKKRKWISDEDADEFDSLRKDLRSHFGKDGDIVQEAGTEYGKPRPKQMDAEVLRMGTRMTYLMMKGGLRSFSDYCEAMKDELPDIFDEMRPHLKSLYAAAQNMEEVIELGWDEEMDDRKTVKAFDVYNFDKPGAKDIISTAQHTVDENASQQQTDKIIQTLKDQRNEQRKKEADETSADTEAIIDKAETTASQVESKLEAANSEEAAEGLSRSLDKELEEVNKQLALLGYYEVDPVDKDFNEAYGYMRNAERKAVQDAHRLATQLASDLGITIDPKDKVRKAKYGFGSKIARSNVAPAGGEVYITLPLAEGRELSIWLSLDKNEPWRDGGREDRTNEDLMLTGIMYRVENTGKGGMDRFVSSNHNTRPTIPYDELLSDIRRLVRSYLPDDTVKPATPLAPQPGEDIVDMAKRVAADKEPKAPAVEPQLPIGDLFGGLFDEQAQSGQPKPIGKGAFGEIYNQFKGRVKEAVALLMTKRSGDIIGVFSRKGFGDVDFVWGDKNGGFAHILDKHVGAGKSFATAEEAVQEIDRIIKHGEIAFENGDKIVFKDDTKLVTVRKNLRKGGKKIADKNWVLTAYDNSGADNASAISKVDSTPAAPTGTLESDSKGNDKSLNSKGNEKTDVQPRTEGTGRGRQQPRPDEPLGEGAKHEDERTDGGRMAQRGGEHTVSDTGRGAGVSGQHKSERGVTAPHTPATPKNTRNNHAERGMDYAPKGEKARIDANIAEFEAISKRDGNPFKDAEALAKAEEKLAEYEELMKAEMAAKEAKYAEMDKDVEAASGIELTEEDSEPTASEPVSEYSAENANFASRYETQDGKTVRYTSENPEAYGGLFDFDFSGENRGGYEVSNRAGADKVQRQGDSRLYQHDSRLDDGAGEFCVVERVFTESGTFNFTSGEKIESAADVAFIFSALEDAAKEHSFVVLVKDGQPTVVELGMGTFTATMVDLPTASLAYNRIRPDQVYFVHNHPSGNLMCSPQDVQMLKKIGEMSDVPVMGVIINLKTGKYGTFDTNNNTDTVKKRIPANESALTVHTLDKQIFAPDYDPMAQPLVRGSRDVATFLNSHRMGDRAKVSFIIMSRAGRIVGNIHTPFTEIPADVDEIARYISERVIHFGGESAILYGDFATATDKGVAYRKLKERMMQVGATTLLDVVNVKGNHTTSANDEGLLYEPGSEYGASAEGDIRYRQDEGAVLKFNSRFNFELQQQIDGHLAAGHIYQLGNPGSILISTGVPNLPIQMSATRLQEKATEYGHDFDLKEIRNLVKELQTPIAVFAYGNKSRMQNIIVGIESNGKQFIVGLSLNPTVNGRALEINSVRNVFPKNNAEWLNWISQGKLLYADKEKIQALIDKQRTILADVDYLDLEDVAKVVKEFENPAIEGTENRREMAQTSAEAMRGHAEKLAKKFNTPIQVVTDPKELTSDNAERQARMRRSKGFYDPSTGKVVVVLPNNANVEDVAETVFHEVVAHKGLREMLGDENYDAFCDEVYDHLKDELKEEVARETTRRFEREPEKGYEYHRRVSVDEMFGRMAEKGFEDFTKAERGIWAKLKAKVLEAINKFLGSLKLPKWVKLGDNELRYMLWRSHEKLRTKGDYVDMARDAVKREELGLSAEARFRDGETGDIWKDQSVGLQERITNAAIRLSNNQSGDLTLRNDAQKAVVNNLQSLLHSMRNGRGTAQSFVGADRKVEAGVVGAMNAQAMFDRATVKRVSDLARILMQNGYLSGMTSGEMQRLLSAVKNSTAMHDISDSVQKIMDIMVNNQLRNAEGALRQLLSIRGSKVDARGVEVQGVLDVEGQCTMEVVKEAMSLTEDDINDRIAEALNRMSDPDQTIADQAALEYAGLNMALDYVQNIAGSKAEEKTLRDSLKTAKEDRDAGRMTDDAYKQFVEATEDAIRKNKVERAEAYFNLVGRLSDSLRESIENAKAFREAEKARVNKIHHFANSDMEGRPTNEHHKDNWKDKFVNNGFVQFLFAPLGTFDQILREN